jgi:4-hydroxy-3-methylbut-2-enyl diphosphate reductase
MNPSAPPQICAHLAFDANNRLAVRKLGGKQGLAFTGSDPAMALQRLESSYPEHTRPVEMFSLEAAGRAYRVFFVQVTGEPKDSEIALQSIDALLARTDSLAPSLLALLRAIDPHLVQIPYLHLSESDFIYKFRPEKERNPGIYAQDAQAEGLYQSRLCAAIKELARQHERTAVAPVTLDFGAVQYLIPSHFGFCLGVRNAIERAYETLAANPGRRVFMLSELIHNPFVNDDLRQRGLLYLQSDKGVPLTVDGRKTTEAPGVALRWDGLTSDDIVIIPAFGATDDDKARLVRKGIAVFQHDATCMLVEKVWKAARTYGRDGYTVVIHGKSEHEETKATFANTRRYAQAVIVRNLEETRRLIALAGSRDPAERARFYEVFAGKFTPGFDVDRDLQRVAVVNQTTLLMNETRAIIQALREGFAEIHGPDRPGEPARVGGSGRHDTLCYATQVNQDALARALQEPLDAAFVIGGKNSSNTYQLYRLCEQKLPGRAFFIQSEASIKSRESVEHYVFPGHESAGSTHAGHVETHPLWPDDFSPKQVLITGGASCPDGIIQQVIHRINSLWPPDRLRPIEAVLADLQAARDGPPSPATPA